MIHPKTELKFISDEIGYGVVATDFIPKGTITWVLDKFDLKFTPKQESEMESHYKEVLDKYAYRDNKGNYILCWDISRFVNHSFNSNCLSTAYDFELAVRDIQKGEQLTDDYGYLNVDKPFQGIDEGTLRKVVYPNDLLKYHKLWDSKLLESFKYLSHVEQPLKHLINDSLWRKIERINDGNTEMDSILNNFYKQKTEH